jgi:hypothetical protein
MIEYALMHPWLTFWLALAALCVVNDIVRLPNRVLRHWNIRKHGYPPPHCDADGDFKEEDSCGCNK